MNFLPINVAAGASRALARSALPDAPVVEDKPGLHRTRAALRALRSAVTRTARDDGRPPGRRTASRKPAESC